MPVDAQPLLPLRPLPSHFSADLRESQDRVLGRLGATASPLAPRGDANGLSTDFAAEASIRFQHWDWESGMDKSGKKEVWGLCTVSSNSFFLSIYDST